MIASLHHIGQYEISLYHKYLYANVLFYSMYLKLVWWDAIMTSSDTTFDDIRERIYVSFLALTLLKNTNEHHSWAKQYAAQTMAYGGFDVVEGQC